jgi:deoxyadenosine/deoxycytidine kinase
MERYKHKSDGIITIYERSVRASREIFLERIKNQIDMEDLTFLSELAALAQSEFEKDVLTLYITCSNAEMLSRWNKRDRPSEKKMQYVNSIIQLIYYFSTRSPFTGRRICWS